MSIVETPAPALDPFVVKWIGYALAAIGTAAPLAVLILGGSPLGQTLILVTAIDLLVLLALMVAIPEAFLVTPRGGTRQIVNYVLAVPVLALLVVSFDSFLVRWEVGGFVALAAAGVALLAGVWAPRRTVIPDMLAYLALIGVFGAGYGWGMGTLVNRYFDRAQGQLFQVEVLSAYRSYGKGTHYHLILAPWGPVTTTTNVSVSYSTFANASQGSTVCVILHPGALAMAWYHVGGC